MANVTSVSMILLVFIITVVSSQTFQYSRGWTNGKRSDIGTFGLGLPTEFKMNFPLQEIKRQTNDPSTIQCGLRQLKMLLQENSNDQIYSIPCDLLNILTKVIEEYQFATNTFQRSALNKDID